MYLKSVTNYGCLGRFVYLCQLMKKVAFHTLGCKLNFSETSSIARQFSAAGWQRVDFPQSADVYIVNTCSVTDNADRECRSIVNRAMSANPEANIVIVGCYAQLKPHEIATIPGVDLVLGAAEKFNVLSYLEQLNKQEPAKVMACEIDQVTDYVSAYSSGDRTRVFLKVQDGCDYSCSFCTIPLARGSSRSDSLENVVKTATKLAADGIKEIVLTGVNLGDFKNEATSTEQEKHFIDLAKALDEIDGIERYRISSIEPNLLTDEVIRFVAASKKFVPHFHIPLQSGSDVTLRAMRRRYLTPLYASRINLIKELMPHAGIGVDVIVGFPGEAEEHFNATFDFLHKLNITYLHVFTYSERPNTKAIEMEGIVPMNERKRRNKVLRNLSLKKQNAFYESNIGQVHSVLFESENNKGLIYGYTANYCRVVMPFNADYINQIVKVEMTGINPEGFVEVKPIMELVAVS